MATDAHAAPLKGIAADLLGARAGAGLRVGVVHTQWNAPVIDALVAGVRRELLARGVAPEDIFVEAAPGAYELPLAARLMLSSPAFRPRGGLDAVVCVGCLIKGETMHFEYICEGVTQVRAGRAFSAHARRDATGLFSCCRPVRGAEDGGDLRALNARARR